MKRVSQNNRDALMEMRGFAKGCFEDAVDNIHDPERTPEQKDQDRRDAVQAIIAYATVDTALSLDQ